MKATDAIEEFLRSREMKNASPHTIRSYRWGLNKLSNRHDRVPVPEQLRELLLANSYLSDQSIRDLWIHWRAFYAWLAHEGFGEDAMSGVAAPIVRKKLPRTLSEDEIRQLLSAADCDRDFTIISVLLDNGVRIGELTSMRRRGITPETITVTGKTGDRVVPISPPVYALLVRQGAGEDVWVGREGRLTRWGLIRVVRRTMECAGFHPPKIGPHTLRHTFALHYVLGGGNAFSLRQIMGHKDIASTMIYVEMSIALLSEQHQKFSPMARILGSSELQPRWTGSPSGEGYGR